MSTILNTNGESLKVSRPEREDYEVHIITADWNPSITHALRDGAEQTLREAGIKRIVLHSVPGTVELVNAAASVVKACSPAAVIVTGCVIRGDTPHFDYVCMQAANGIAAINAQGTTPVIFGVLTVDTLEQAQERAGGILGNKGAEAAAAAIEMANLHSRLGV